MDTASYRRAVCAPSPSPKTASSLGCSPWTTWARRASCETCASRSTEVERSARRLPAPSALEIRQSIGAGDVVVGVTRECYYPPGVENLPGLTTTSNKLLFHDQRRDGHAPIVRGHRRPARRSPLDHI